MRSHAINLFQFDDEKAKKQKTKTIKNNDDFCAQ